MTRLFTDIFRDLERGQLAEELTNELANLVQEVVTLGKVGKLQINLDVAPNGMGACNIKAGYKTTSPKPDRAQTMMFHDAEGNLTREDPRQREMTFKEVETPTNFKEA